MSSFKDFLGWYNNKNVVSILEAMQKVVAFYDDENIDMILLGCTLPKQATICSHKSIEAKFRPVMEGQKDVEKLRKNVVGGPSVVFTREAVADKTFTRK